MEPVYVFMFEQLDEATGAWERSGRLATLEAIAKLGARARPVPGSGRLVFPELIGNDGFVTAGYAP